MFLKDKREKKNYNKRKIQSQRSQTSEVGVGELGVPRRGAAVVVAVEEGLASSSDTSPKKLRSSSRNFLTIFSWQSSNP